MEEKKYITHTHIIIVIVAVLALILSIISLVKTTNNNKSLEIVNETKTENDNIDEEVTSYKVYIGLTDKDKNYQKVKTDIAIEILKNLCVSKQVTYTIYEAQGAHKDENGIMHAENTLILEMDHIDESMLNNISNEISKRLNVQEIMITKNPAKVYYFSQKK